MYRQEYRSEPKEPTQFGSVSGLQIQNLPFSHSGIVSLYRSEPKEQTKFGSVSGSEIQNICIGRNLANQTTFQYHFTIILLNRTFEEQNTVAAG